MNSSFWHWVVRSVGLLLLSGLLLSVSCHPYRLPTPQGPSQPKVKRGVLKPKGDENADGTVTSNEKTELKVQRNSYDKNGLLKKEKYERRRLKKKVGYRSFLGIPLPF
ncbi:hypothetical protein LJY25_13250 [Hymenobacter sp. BT175]|uniref:hypothetical protein n=1 Tax=Hymenobacter translucens TaxID=2886507 RepID=UPI001D0DE640|nr:hypothetical protein [Hymenobacter translucens]MCC2547416.1 hypothetical protein [Hymenobacter translucens]